MKKIIKKRVLECLIEQQKNIEYTKMFPHDIDLRLSKILELREKYNDIIPLTSEMRQDALDYTNYKLKKTIQSENYYIFHNLQYSTHLFV